MDTPNPDFRVKEALLHSLGDLKEPIQNNAYLMSMMEAML
jgi:hypothetical protein